MDSEYSDRRVWTPPAGVGQKEQFRRLEKSGFFGNRLRDWSSYQALLASGYTGWLRISGQRASSPYKVDEVEFSQLDTTIAGLQRRGARLEDLYFGEVPSRDNQRIINFEVGPCEQHLCLIYGTRNIPLRPDLQGKEPVYGLQAQVILRHFLEADYDTLEHIWHYFPYAIIEGSRWEEQVGVLGHRMIPWEVRMY